MRHALEVEVEVEAGWVGLKSINLTYILPSRTDKSIVDSRQLHKHTGDENVGPILVCLPRPHHMHPTRMSMSITLHFISKLGLHAFAGRNPVAAWKPHSREYSDATRFTVEFNIQDIENNSGIIITLEI
ncbi:hypothetical protein GX48_05805 [Paracoccidioides brasiliensis]|nr:hypothetical protein GX48_05805 [Paracoccidioides brasiliensis]